MKKIWGSKKTAILLSYFSIFAQTLSTIILTKIYLDKLGADMYGLYQMIYSVAHYILILDLGISTTMIRFIAEFETKKNEEKKENFLFHFLFIIAFLVIIVSIIGVIINNNLENIYTSLTLEEYKISHTLFSIMVIQIVLTIVAHFFEGIAMAKEQYAFVKLIDSLNIVFNAILVIALLYLNIGVLGIAIAGLVSIIVKLFPLVYIDFVKLKVKIKYHYIDIPMLQPAFVLMLAMLLQSIIGHVNSSVDKTILGIMSTKTEVAVYAIAATFVTMFNSLPSAISSVFQTRATQLVSSGATPDELTEFIIKPGRFQFMVTGGFIAGFILFGKDFITCWAGKDMINAWIYTLIIIIPNMIPLIQNVCLPILNAMDKRIFRSLILVSITIINIILTIILIKHIGPIGAPIATGIAYLIGHVVLMNIYYYKKIKLNVLKMFKDIFHKTLFCVILAFAINLPLMFIINNITWLNLIIKAGIFCLTYAILLLIFGLNKEEKEIVNRFLRKIKLIKE